MRESGLRENKIDNIEDAYKLLFCAMEKNNINSTEPVFGKFMIDMKIVKCLSYRCTSTNSHYTFELMIN